MTYSGRGFVPMTFGMDHAPQLDSHSEMVTLARSEMRARTTCTTRTDPSPTPHPGTWPEARLLVEALTEQEHTDSMSTVTAPTKIGTVRIEHLRRLVAEGDTITVRGERGTFDVRAIATNGRSTWLDCYGGSGQRRQFRAIALDRVASVTTDGVATRKLQEKNR